MLHPFAETAVVTVAGRAKIATARFCNTTARFQKSKRLQILLRPVAFFLAQRTDFSLKRLFTFSLPEKPSVCNKPL